jgi:RNA recognition motif-containing protein
VDETTEETTETSPDLPCPDKDLMFEIANTQIKPAGAKTYRNVPGTNLFIFHLPPSWDESHLQFYFGNFGQIQSCRVQRDEEGRCRGYGFVAYTTTEAAQLAILNMNEFHIEGKWLKVQLKKGDPPSSGYTEEAASRHQRASPQILTREGAPAYPFSRETHALPSLPVYYHPYMQMQQMSPYLMMGPLTYLPWSI